MDTALRNYFRYRQRKIEEVIANPVPYQNAIRQKILKNNSDCEYGRAYNFKSISDQTTFSKAVPLVYYEDIAKRVGLMIEGKKKILTSDPVSWFAKSSGTSNGRSKFIPVTESYMIKGHLKCTWATASFIYNEDPKAQLFKNKNLIMGGSLKILDNGIRIGDISAILLYNFPKIGRRFSTPDFDTALISDWETKIQKIVKICSKESVTTLAGVPTWTMVLIKQLLKYNEVNNISELWPELRSYLHGGIGFDPYRKLFREYMPSEKTVFREVYNASEGYFGIQNSKDEDGVLLLCDHEIFYEFIPLENIDNVQPDTLTLEQVQLGYKYALVISNTSGLYRYIIGDVVEFVSVRPYKIKVRGRTKQSINIFGEELMIANTEKAIASTSKQFGLQVYNYTVAPIFMTTESKGGHEWAIEFVEDNIPIEQFSKALDRELRLINSDYDAKRSSDLALECLKITKLKQGTFDAWFKSIGNYGGQTKIKKLSPDRQLINALIAFEREKVIM